MALEEAETLKDNINILSLEDIKGHTYIERLDLEGYVYLIEFDDRFIIAKRTGKCDFKKCKNACCKFCSFKHQHEYFEGFGDYCKKSNSIIIKKTCKFLSKDGTCQKWGKTQGEQEKTGSANGRISGFPRACEQFPHISDEVFWRVMEVCGFKYEKILTLPKFGQKRIDEMILNFKEQGKW